MKLETKPREREKISHEKFSCACKTNHNKDQSNCEKMVRAYRRRIRSSWEIRRAHSFFVFVNSRLYIIFFLQLVRVEQFCSHKKKIWSNWCRIFLWERRDGDCI